MLSDKGVNHLVKPLVDDVSTARRPDLISLGFLIALWSGSRAVNVFVDTITIMYGLEGRRGIVTHPADVPAAVRGRAACWARPCCR